MLNLPTLSRSLSHFEASSFLTPCSLQITSSSAAITSAGIFVEEPEMYTAAPDSNEFQTLHSVPLSYVVHRPFEADPWKKQQTNRHLFWRKAPPHPGHELTRNPCIENHYLDSYSQKRIELGPLVLLQSLQLFPPQMHGMAHILFLVR